jgi:hypothetical protein
MIDLNCLCDPFKEISCSGNCKNNLPHVSYLNWMATTCAGAQSWAFADGVSYSFPSNANLTFLDEAPSAPSCFSAEDRQDLDLCVFDTSAIQDWVPSGYELDWSHAKVLDRDCYCGTFSYHDTMKRSSCGGEVDLSLTQRLVWLNTYCGDYPGFTAAQLPNNWTNLLLLSNSTFPESEVLQQAWNDSQIGSNCAYTPIFEALTEGCNSGQRCADSTIDGCNAPVDTLSLDCFCGNFLFPNTMQNICGEDDIGYSEILVWLHEKCHAYPSFISHLPNDWHNLVRIVNKTFISSETLSSSWPECLDQNQCASHGLSSSAAGLRFDGDIFDNNSTAPVSTTNISDFCEIVRYSGECGQQCLEPWWDRAAVLDYLVQICGSVPATGRSLPFFPPNYDTEKLIKAAEMLPWKWAEIRPEDSTVDDDNNSIVNTENDRTCPSAAGKLGSFAAVNVVMALILPILGRRTVWNRLTRGRFGKANSHSWLWTGLAGIGLHLASNAVNAAIIQSSPGYSDVSIGHLTLLWCTRPRLSWLVAALVPFQAKKAMYFSVTASTLISESVLQIIGAVYMGIATNYARNNRFYQPSTFKTYGGVHGHDAQIMFAGSLLWLCVFPFAILACMWSVLGISTHIRSLSVYLTQMVSTANSLRKQAVAQIAELESIDDRPRENTPDDLRVHYQRLSTYRHRLQGDWERLQVLCIPIPDNLRTERRQHIVFLRQLEESGQSTALDLNLPWFTSPSLRETHSLNAATAATAATAASRPIKTASKSLAAQLKRSQDHTGTLNHAEADLLAQERDLIAAAKFRLKAATANDGIFTRLGRATTQRTPETEQLLSPDEKHTRATLRHRLRALADEKSLSQTLTSHLFPLCDLHALLLSSGTSLSAAHSSLAVQWAVVSSDRHAEAAEAQRRNFRRIPMIVVGGMLLTWIAQWLWWVGYVNVAADTYCPPKVVVMTVVWTGFSVSGAAVGASF